MKLYQYKDMFFHWCEPCGHTHQFTVPRWTFNGNMESPSFTPSMREFLPASPEYNRPERTLCHYFLTDGVIHYCSDAPHALAGQSLPLVDIPKDYGLPGRD